MSESSPVKGALEALLFVSDEPVSAARLAKVVDAAPGQVESALADLAEEYREQERGFQLREVAGGWRLYTHPAHHDVIETLRAVVGHQTALSSGSGGSRGRCLPPACDAGRRQRGAWGQLRGVIASLVEKGLVREVGRDKNQGNAILYGTTRTFLEKFGLNDIGGLPPLAEFAPDSVTESAIRDRLSSTDRTSDESDHEDLEDEIAEVD